MSFVFGLYNFCKYFVKVSCCRCLSPGTWSARTLYKSSAKLASISDFPFLLIVDFWLFSREIFGTLLTRHKHEKYQQWQPIDTATAWRLVTPTPPTRPRRHRAVSAPVTCPAGHLHAWSLALAAVLMQGYRHDTGDTVCICYIRVYIVFVCLFSERRPLPRGGRPIDIYWSIVVNCFQTTFDQNKRYYSLNI